MLVTSAVAGEGKSTTAAHLALAYALTGRDVVLVDLDLRRPAIARLVGLPSGTGRHRRPQSSATLDQALRPVAFDSGEPRRPRAGVGRGRARHPSDHHCRDPARVGVDHYHEPASLPSAPHVSPRVGRPRRRRHPTSPPDKRPAGLERLRRRRPRRARCSAVPAPLRAASQAAARDVIAPPLGIVVIGDPSGTDKHGRSPTGAAPFLGVSRC